MSGHHDTHHVNENKPVAFTVPLILGIVTLIITLLFLSLCDPSHANHNAEGHGHGAAASHGGDHDKNNHSSSHSSSHEQGPEGGQDAHH